MILAPILEVKDIIIKLSLIYINNSLSYRDPVCKPLASSYNFSEISAHTLKEIHTHAEF